MYRNHLGYYLRKGIKVVDFNEFLKELQKVQQDKQFRIYSILIGGNSSELKRWSDEVWNVTDLLDETIAKELFQKI